MFSFNGNKYRSGIMHKLFPLHHYFNYQNDVYLTINNPNVSYDCGIYQGMANTVTLALDYPPQTDRSCTFFFLKPFAIPYTYCTGNSYDTYVKQFLPLDKKTAPVAELAVFNLVKPQRNFIYDNNLKDNENIFGVNAPMATYYQKINATSTTGYYHKFLYGYSGGSGGSNLFTVGYPSNISLNNVTQTFRSNSTSNIVHCIIKNVQGSTNNYNTYIEILRRGSSLQQRTFNVKVFATINFYHHHSSTPSESDSGMTTLPSSLNISFTESKTSGDISVAASNSDHTATKRATRKTSELKKRIFTYDINNEEYLKNMWLAATGAPGTRILPGFDSDNGPIEKFWDLYVINTSDKLKDRLNGYTNLELTQACASYYAEFEFTTDINYTNLPYISIVPHFNGPIDYYCGYDYQRAYSIENLIVAINY